MSALSRRKTGKECEQEGMSTIAPPRSRTACVRWDRFSCLQNVRRDQSRGEVK